VCKRENAADALADLQAWVGEPFDAAGRRYDGGKESVDRFWKDLKTDQGMSVEPRYVELAFGCPPIERDIDMRVRDFADRMGDEYTSLYEKGETGIKGGDFERFGAFVDNRLDFMRALTKARAWIPSAATGRSAHSSTHSTSSPQCPNHHRRHRKRTIFCRRMRSGRQHDSHARFSLAGNQPKFTLARIGDRWAWPNAAIPSTHIFKPPEQGTADADIVEAASNRLVRLCGLESSKAGVMEFAGERTYVIERFDRRPLENGKVARLHTEDFLQSLGLPPERKYTVKAKDVLHMLHRADPADGLCYSWIAQLALNVSVGLQRASPRFMPHW
jgi:serine/threonine-protein kinase HipA